MSLEKVAKVLAAHGQKALASEVAEVSLQSKTAVSEDHDFEFEFTERMRHRLTETIEPIIKGTGGKVVDAQAYAPAKGGGWIVVLSNEYAALKVYYTYRHSKVNREKGPKGWAVSVR